MRAAVRWRAPAGRSRRPSRRRRARARAHGRGHGSRDCRRDRPPRAAGHAPRCRRAAVRRPHRPSQSRRRCVCVPHVHARATQTLFTPVWSSIAILAHLVASAAAFMPLRGFGMLDVSRTTGTGQAYGGRCFPPTAAAPAVPYASPDRGTWARVTGWVHADHAPIGNARSRVDGHVDEKGAITDDGYRQANDQCEWSCALHRVVR